MADDEKGVVKFRDGYTLLDRHTSAVNIDPQDLAVGPGFVPFLGLVQEDKPFVDWPATRRKQAERTQARSDVLATRFKRAAELLGMLTARAEAINSIQSAQAPEESLQNPAAAKFDKPHLWRGLSQAHEPDGLWIDPEAPQRDEALQFGHEIHDLLKGKVKA